MSKQNNYQENIYTALVNLSNNNCGETIGKLSIEPENSDDPEYRKSTPLVNNKPNNNNDTNLSIWKDNYIRLFISHRDSDKSIAADLAYSLEGYGICAFVAHDTIEAKKKWGSEIINGLKSMDIMLALITDDFHKSVWTNQEIGFAIGQEVEIISLKLGKADPEGFIISEEQALKVNAKNISEATPEIVKLITKTLDNKLKLQRSLIKAFIDSPNYNETRKRFERLITIVRKLDGKELLDIINGYNNNKQLYGCIYITNHHKRLIKFLQKCTDDKHHYVISEGKLSCTKLPVTETEVQF